MWVIVFSSKDFFVTQVQMILYPPLSTEKSARFTLQNSSWFKKSANSRSSEKLLSVLPGLELGITSQARSKFTVLATSAGDLT